MCGCKKIFTIFGVMLLTVPSCYAQQILVESVRYNVDGKQSTIVFEVTESAKYKFFVSDNPSRLVVDVKDAQTKALLKQPSSSNPLFSNIRTTAKNESELRIVVGLKQPVTAKNYKVVTNSIDKRHFSVSLVNKDTSLVLDKTKKPDSHTIKKVNASIETMAKPEKASLLKSKQTAKRKQPFIVAIDAGHGGDDPGAKGPNGTLEKQATLLIATKLQGLINGQPGMKAKLVRKGDYYVGLRERMKIARQAKADFFISIHADACQNPEVKGASVYTLSRNGASSEAARWLANSENAKEKVGGVNLDDKDEVLASVLLDLSQTATQQASLTLASKVLKHFQNIGELHYNNVQKAGFAVLKSPDIPSILVETAYISNPSDELNLMSTRYQTKMANAIFKGILNYIEQIEPAEVNRVAKL